MTNFSLECFSVTLLRSLRGKAICQVTTALGLGLHFPNVPHIVIYGVPGDLETIVQQVGRARRHDQPKLAILNNTYKVD